MNNDLPKERRSADRAGWAIALLLATAFFVVNLWLQIGKWNAFHIADFDIGNAASLLREVCNGQFRFLDPGHLYGPLLSQFYLLYLLLFFMAPSHITLMVVMSAAFAAAIVLTYAAGRTVFQGTRWPLLFTFAVAANPLFWLLSLSGFRQSAPVLPAVLGLFIAWRRGHKGWFVACAVLAAAAQANVALALAPLGVALLRRDRVKFYGRTLLATAGGFLALNFALLFLARYLSGIEPPEGMFHLIAFGRSPGEALRTMFVRPGLVLENIFYYKNLTLLLFVVTFLSLPLLAPLWLTGAAFELVYMALSTRGLTELAPRTAWAVNLDHRIFSFFNTGMITVLPFFIVAALLGAGRLGLWARKNSAFFAGKSGGALIAVLFVAATALLHFYLTPNDYGPVPGARGADWSAVQADEHDRLREHRLQTLAGEYTYLMQFSFYFHAYHISQRTLLTAEKAAQITFDYVLLDTRGDCPIVGLETCAKLWRQLPADPRYRVAWEEDGIILLCRKTLL